MFEIDIERKSQYPFVIFMGQKQHGDEIVLKAQGFIENNPTATFTVDEICDKFGVMCNFPETIIHQGLRKIIIRV